MKSHLTSPVTSTFPGDMPTAKPPFQGFVRFVMWIIFGLMTTSVFMFTSLPMLQSTHPLHDLLYSQRWMLFPHIAAGVMALIIGPLQFSRRLRQGNIARHRLLGKLYVGAVVVAAVLAPAIAWDYPAFFPFGAALQSGAWLVATGAAFLTARNRHIEQHRRWMARSYAIGSVFVFVRVLNPVPAFAQMSFEASSYSILVFMVAATMVADLIVDWPVITPSVRRAS
jgi:uncharacterized membrane protein